jgi:secreted trypsin-like serine protease
MRYLILSLIILLGLSSAPAMSGTRDPNTPDSKHLAYGQKHQCVVQVKGQMGFMDKNGEKMEVTASGSGVIIDKRYILTAAHVVQKTKDPYIILNGKKIKIEWVVIPNKFAEENTGPYDIALCRLDEDAIIDFYPELYSKDDEMGKLCSLAGWGMHGTWKTGTIYDDNKRRAGSNYIDPIMFRGMIVCSVQGTKSQTSLEFLIGHGDSGGGLFIDKKLAGIHSCIYTGDGNLDSSYKDYSAHTRVSIHKEWIDLITKDYEKILETIEKASAESVIKF